MTDKFTSKSALESLHTKKAIAERISGQAEHGYLGDFVLGAVDGAITTFAIVAGAAGAGFSNSVAVILGVANVFADGISMAAGNYLKARSDQEHVDRFRKIEEYHIEQVPDAEREEVRQIYAAKGFEGQLLDDVVLVITEEKTRWVNTMITEEWGLPLVHPEPLRVALVTFISFVGTGFIPLLPLMIMYQNPSDQTFTISVVLTGCCFFMIGYVRGKLALTPNPMKTALETLLIGGTAAIVAFTIGRWLEGM